MGCGGSSANYNPLEVSLEHFTLERELGRGGFGKVNAVVRKSDKEWYAMKTLGKKIILEKRCVSMIIQERDLASMVSHEFLVNMHFAFQDRENCYIVLDLALGGDLRYHLDQDPEHKMDEERARFYSAGIILAIDYMHSQKILHRDIKPDNVVLDKAGYPKLTDLGVSFLAKGPTLESFSRSGTKPYMAPEQVNGNRWHNKAADYYQLGITLYELLIGRRPYPDSGIPAALLAKLDPDNADIGDLDKSCVVSLPAGCGGTPCRDFLKDTLEFAWWKRAGRGDVQEEVKAHAFFSGFDWAAFERKTMPAPFVPDTTKANCDTGQQEAIDMFGDAPSGKENWVSDEDDKQFAGYDYGTDLSGGAGGGMKRRITKVARRMSAAVAGSPGAKRRPSSMPAVGEGSVAPSG